MINLQQYDSSAKIELVTPVTDQRPSKKAVLFYGFGKFLPKSVARSWGYEILENDIRQTILGKILTFIEPSTGQAYRAQCNCATGNPANGELKQRYLPSNILKFLYLKFLVSKRS